MSENGAEVQKLQGGNQVIMSLAFSPDGALLASGDVLGKVRVWDLKTMQVRLELPTFPDMVLRVGFSPDGRLAASSVGGTTYFYTVQTDELIQLVRDRIVSPMEPGECLKYLGSETCPPLP